MPRTESTHDTPVTEHMFTHKHWKLCNAGVYDARRRANQNAAAEAAAALKLGPGSPQIHDDTACNSATRRICLNHQKAPKNMPRTENTHDTPMT